MCRPRGDNAALSTDAAAERAAAGPGLPCIWGPVSLSSPCAPTGLGLLVSIWGSAGRGPLTPPPNPRLTRRWSALPALRPRGPERTARRSPAALARVPSRGLGSPHVPPGCGQRVPCWLLHGNAGRRSPCGGNRGPDASPARNWRSEKRGPGSPVTVVGCDPFSTPSAGEWSRAATSGPRDRCSSGPSWGRTDDPVACTGPGERGIPAPVPRRMRPPTCQIQIRAQQMGFPSQSLRPLVPARTRVRLWLQPEGIRPRPGRTCLCTAQVPSAVAGHGPVSLPLFPPAANL